MRMILGEHPAEADRRSQRKGAHALLLLVLDRTRPPRECWACTGGHSGRQRLWSSLRGRENLTLTPPSFTRLLLSWCQLLSYQLSAPTPPRSPTYSVLCHFCFGGCFQCRLHPEGARESAAWMRETGFNVSACSSFLEAHLTDPSPQQQPLFPVAAGSSLQVFSTLPEPVSSWPLARYQPQVCPPQSPGPSFQVLIISVFSLVFQSLGVVSCSCYHCYLTAFPLANTVQLIPYIKFALLKQPV